MIDTKPRLCLRSDVLPNTGFYVELIGADMRTAWYGTELGAMRAAFRKDFVKRNAVPPLSKTLADLRRVGWSLEIGELSQEDRDARRSPPITLAVDMPQAVLPDWLDSASAPKVMARALDSLTADMPHGWTRAMLHTIGHIRLGKPHLRLRVKLGASSRMPLWCVTPSHEMPTPLSIWRAHCNEAISDAERRNHLHLGL